MFKCFNKHLCIGCGGNMNQADEKSLKTLTTVIYALYGVSIFFGLTAIVAIIMNYVKKDDVKGTVFESHFRWQIRTFWFGMLWMLLAGLTMFVGIGFILFPIAVIWFIYRVVKGFMYLNDGKAMYQ